MYVEILLLMKFINRSNKIDNKIKYIEFFIFKVLV
jgi:hypothetical protein